jgi:hypothetical protein
LVTALVQPGATRAKQGGLRPSCTFRNRSARGVSRHLCLLPQIVAYDNALKREKMHVDGYYAAPSEIETDVGADNVSGYSAGWVLGGLNRGRALNDSSPAH